MASEVHWHRPFDTVLDSNNEHFPKWFAGGKLNIAYNCLDRHIQAGHGSDVCFFEESAYTGKSRAWTYQEVYDQSGRLASVLQKKFGIQKGDRVVIYMPMIIEAAFTMLACARVGAIHSVVFGGFAAKELAKRIEHLQPKLVVTASYGLEPGKQIAYPPIVDEALKLCKFEGATDMPRLIKQRDKLEYSQLSEAYHDYDALLSQEKEVASIVPVESNHPLYVLYTSGTTGAPKGIVRDHGGTAVALNYAIKNIYNIHRGETHWSVSDIGWVVGHSFIVYGPLLVGAKSIFFEGKPITPNAGIVWELIHKYRIKTIFKSPTAIRILKKMDFDGNYIKRFDLSCL